MYLKLWEERRCSARVSAMTDYTRATPTVRGRPFAKGNGGRRPGSKNQSTRLLAALSNDDKAELIRKGVELALAGDTTMLKFFLQRILPRERSVSIDLPKMEYADDAVEALGSIAAAIGEEKITPSEGAIIAALVNSYARAIDTADVVKRLDALEARINGTA